LDVPAASLIQQGDGPAAGADPGCAPRRVQLRRSKGWRMPANTLKVDRTTCWGNPYVVGFCGLTLERCIALYRNTVLGIWDPGMLTDMTDDQVRQIYALHCAWRARNPQPPWMLEGRNLACWCRLPAQGEQDCCHAAVLLELANQDL
jgi:hypothetical protein